MGNIVRFAIAVARHWGSLVTGGVIIGLLGTYQGVGHLVSHWVYWAVAAVGLAVAVYLAWKDEFVRASRAEEALRNPPISGKDWEWIAETMQQCCQFIGIACEWTDKSSVRTWRVQGGDHVDTCAAWLARAGKMLLESPKVSLEIPVDIRQEPDDFTRWCLYLEHRGHLRRSYESLTTSIMGEQTQHYTARVDEVWELSVRLFMEFSAKEFKPGVDSRQ